MLMGHTDALSERTTSRDYSLADSNGGDEDEDVIDEEEVLYEASFDEFAENHIKYDTIIWLSISLLLVLAWGVGIIMLLYVPYRRYVLRKDVSSRKLYVTPDEIVYKVSRPSYIPFWGMLTIEKHVPLSLVIDIIIEQGCLQSYYGIHTVRVESIAHGKAAPVDELQVQGVVKPALLRKIIITEASKNKQDIAKGLKPNIATAETESMSRMASLSEGPTFKSPSKSWKITGSPRYSSPRYTPSEGRGVVPGDMLLNKIEEVSRSVKKIELLIEKRS